MVRDALPLEAADFDFVEFMPRNGKEHPVHPAVVMAWTTVGPVLEMVLEPPVSQTGFDGFAPSSCKYGLVIDPPEVLAFPKDMIMRLPVGSVVNVSLKYGSVYDPDWVTFPPSKNGRMPRYLKQLRRLVEQEHLLIGSLAWADQPQAWADFDEDLETGKIINARVVSVAYNRETGQVAGLAVQCGLLRGFVPTGLVDFREKFYGLNVEQILEQMVGQTVQVKVKATWKTDKQTGGQTRSLLLSETAAMEVVRRDKKAVFLQTARPGDKFLGFVTNVQPFGIFVRVDGCCDGLVRPENLIGEAPKLHQPVTVEIIGVNQSRGHLNLRLDNTAILEIIEDVPEPDLEIIEDVSVGCFEIMGDEVILEE